MDTVFKWSLLRKKSVAGTPTSRWPDRTGIFAEHWFQCNCLNRYVLETSYYEYIQDYGRLDESEPIQE